MPLARSGFCFLDAEKEIYGCCYEVVVPRLVQGGFLIADNAINHQSILKPMLDQALHDVRVDALIVPIGNGELVCPAKVKGSSFAVSRKDLVW